MASTADLELIRQVVDSRHVLAHRLTFDEIIEVMVAWAADSQLDTSASRTNLFNGLALLWLYSKPSRHAVNFQLRLCQARTPEEFRSLVQEAIPGATKRWNRDLLYPRAPDSAFATIESNLVRTARKLNSQWDTWSLKYLSGHSSCTNEVLREITAYSQPHYTSSPDLELVLVHNTPEDQLDPALKGVAQLISWSTHQPTDLADLLVATRP